jgi:hypothetical protein
MGLRFVHIYIYIYSQWRVSNLELGPPPCRHYYSGNVYRDANAKTVLALDGFVLFNRLRLWPNHMVKNMCLSINR